jgi:hypothetical protein
MDARIFGISRRVKRPRSTHVGIRSRAPDGSDPTSADQLVMVRAVAVNSALLILLASQATDGIGHRADEKFQTFCKPES